MNTFDETTASAFLRVALAAANRAAEISRSYYAGNFTVTTKDDLTPVTQADVECEQAIREIILQQFPDHGFYGEETGRTQEDADYLWLVIVALLAAVAGLFFYLRVIVIMYMQAPDGGESARPGVGWGARVVLAVAVAVTIAFGVVPWPLLDVVRDAVPL